MCSGALVLILSQFNNIWLKIQVLREQYQRMAKYVHHAIKLLILKQKPKSTDADFQPLISDLKQQMMDTNDSGERAMQTTAIYVAERLLKQECLLLPTVKQKYCSIISKMTQKENQPVQNKPTTQWLLSNLVVYLQHHLNYKCSVRKHGTPISYIKAHKQVNK